MKKILFASLFFVCFLAAQAQELNAIVSVNSSKIQGSRQIFNTLEEQLRTFINDRKWSNENFQTNERIDCSFTLIINEMPSPTSFKGELLVQSRRPIFNATYTTPLLNFREPSFSFDYIEYQPLEFYPNNIPNNLSATIGFYVYLILGLDFDSMSLLGGMPYFRQMQTIANNVQLNNWSGWETFGIERNKYAIALAFNEPAFETYRQMWYDYHRLGLDEMAENPEKGREKVVTSLPVISSIHARRPNSVLVTLFGDAKLDELVNVLTGTSEQVKRQAYKTLRNIYPTQTIALEKIKN
ncbi:MAG: hypothetical protein BWZ00_01713 [Bacteroidetes bacterium ADurb.BinA174]|nr:MAG: hypothetical protein BWZ00_01713 [Bacteroidetes bacterium ADurb.BinA174]